VLSDEAFTDFYRETAGSLRNYAARVLGNISQADDVVQEAYLRLLRHPPPTGNTQELRAYVFRVVSNLIKDGWRREKRESAIRELTTPSEDQRDGALRIDVKRTFLKLRVRDRQLLWLAYVEGESHREIAITLGLSENSVRVLLARARERLSNFLQGSGG
jgi:RNA polymerase sigma-70 factor (ECF subfamily)